MGKHTREILIRVPTDQHLKLFEAKLEISHKQGREITWLTLLKLGIATALVYGVEPPKRRGK